jgi:hypothetical protein
MLPAGQQDSAGFWQELTLVLAALAAAAGDSFGKLRAGSSTALGMTAVGLAGGSGIGREAGGHAGSILQRLLALRCLK